MVQLTVQIWLLSGPENFTALPNYFNFAEFTSGSPFETAYLSTDITMAPLPAISGGTVAEVSTYRAINRNTNRAEEAFFLIGLIMSREYQANSQLFSSVSARDGNMPLDSELDEMMDEVQQVMADSCGAEIGDFYQGQISDEQLREIVHQHYKRMCRLVDEAWHL